MADALLGIETDINKSREVNDISFTLADALLGIETSIVTTGSLLKSSFTLADALLGIETSDLALERKQSIVSLWLMPF